MNARASRLSGRGHPPRLHQRLLIGALLLLTSACAGRPSTTSASGSPAALRVYDSKAGKFVGFSQLIDAASQRDFVFFGEQHDDPATHAAEHAVLAALGERRPRVIVSLEMFERDVQPLLDQYLAGTISEANFLAGSRPWDRYTTDYRPMVELARVHGWPVVASNIPRPLASGVSRRGLATFDTLNARDKRYVAREHNCPHDRYFDLFSQAMNGHGAGGGPPTGADATAMQAMTVRFYEAQCTKDEAMGEAIADAWKAAPKGTLVYHVDGAFHSDYGLGTVERAKRRAPSASSIILTAIPVADLAKADPAEHREKADYVLFTRAPK